MWPYLQLELSNPLALRREPSVSSELAVKPSAEAPRPSREADLHKVTLFAHRVRDGRRAGRVNLFDIDG
jgi:hypothetical protein